MNQFVLEGVIFITMLVALKSEQLLNLILLES